MRAMMRATIVLITAFALGLGPSGAAHAQNAQSAPASNPSWFVRPFAAYIGGLCIPHAPVQELNDSPEAVVSAVSIDHRADSILVNPGETTPAKGSWEGRWVEVNPGPGRLEDMWSPTMASVAHQLDAMGEELIACGDSCLLNVQIHVPQESAAVDVRSKGIIAACALTGTGDVIPPGRLSSIEASGLLGQWINEYLTDHFGVELPGIVTVIADGHDGTEAGAVRSAGGGGSASVSRRAPVATSFDDRVLERSSVDIMVQNTALLADPDLDGHLHYILLPKVPEFGIVP